MKKLWYKYQALSTRNRRLVAFAVGVVLVTFVGSAFGSSPHHTHETHTDGDHTILVNVDVDASHNETGGGSSNVDTAGAIDSHSQSSGVRDSDVDLSRAMSAAGDTCVFDYDPGWQGCVGAGFSGDEQAINLSTVTRYDEMMIRFNAQSDDSLDELAGGAGVSWHF